MIKNFEWIPKQGENWSVLTIKDLNKLTLEQSLKVQEMTDNKTHQALTRESQNLQIKNNRIIIILTTLIALIGIINLSISRYLNPDKIPQELFGIFLVALIILMVVFIYVSASKVR